MGASQETKERTQSAQEREPKVPIALKGIINGIVFSVEDISGYKFSPEQKSKLREIEKRIVEFTPRFFRVAQRAVAVGAIIAIGNYYQTHPELEKTIDENGQTIYTHEDARTTHYLNILAGREKFTQEDLEAELRPGIISKLKEKRIPIPKNLEEMSLDEVYTLYYNNTDPSSIEKPDVYRDINKVWIQMINDQNTLNYFVDKYNLVWELEKESGNPRIRFVADRGITTIASPKFKDADKYDPVTNTVLITSGSFFDPNNGFMDEVSHSRQFGDNPFGSYSKGIRDLVTAIIVGRFDMLRIEEEYDLLYNKPGSLEYEAHNIIKPVLQNKYPLP